MAKRESLLNKIEDWVREGLISPDQAEALNRRALGSAGRILSVLVPTARNTN